MTDTNTSNKSQDDSICVCACHLHNVATASDTNLRQSMQCQDSSSKEPWLDCLDIELVLRGGETVSTRKEQKMS